MKNAQLFRVTACFAPVLGFVLAAAWTTPPQPEKLGFHERANAAIGLSRSALVRMDVPNAMANTMAFQIQAGDQDLRLNLYVHSVRDRDYQLLQQLDDGSIVPVTPGPVRTLRGTVAGEPGSIVAASLLDDGLHASISRADGRVQWLEPLSAKLPDAARADHVFYDTKDVLPQGGTCGMSDKGRADERFAKVGDASSPAIREAVLGAPCIAEIACDADVEYYIDQGSSVPATEAAINTIINNVNVQYERDVNLTHIITTIIVRTGNRNSDPYSSNNPSNLLCEFITEWTNNQTGIARDVAQLFTGRTVQGGTIGIAADLGDICNNEGSCTCHPLFGSDGSYSLVQNIGGGDACRSDLSAHELGHLWGAVHCDCNSADPLFDFTMNPSITCANQFSIQSQFIINTFKAGRTCLEGPCAGTPVTNDVCEGATNVAEGSFPYSTVGVGTECPDLPAACEEGGGLTFAWDLWYRYTASCTGDATISLCDANYDARMVVYDDAGCPPLDTDVVACDDDFCGPGTGSQVTFAVIAGASYMVRVGGFGDLGQATMAISCDGPVPCPADGDGDNLVGITDFLAVLAQWNDVCPCTADSDGDNDVGINDFLNVLSNWGPCP